MKYSENRFETDLVQDLPSLQFVVNYNMLMFEYD